MQESSNVFAIIIVAMLMIASGLIGYWVAPGESGDVDSDAYYQVSTYGRLRDGGYDGMISIERLLEHGDFGIGTVEGIDGEMIVLDGVAYRAGTDLALVKVPVGTLIPFAMITDFGSGQAIGLGADYNYTHFKEYVGEGLNDGHIAYAVMIEAEFESITIRSVPGQQLPYPPLADVVANQTTMVLENVQGTMVGYYMSEGLGDINVPGFHMHFLSESYGGHVLDVEMSDVLVQIDPISSYTVLVSETIIC